VLASGERTCQFCDTSEVDFLTEGTTQERAEPAPQPRTHEEWRGELDQRLHAYRARRRKSMGNEGQSALPFDGEASEPPHHPVATEQPADDFAFTIAIGRMGNATETADPRLLIDVSVPPQLESPEPEQNTVPLLAIDNDMFAAASLDDRKRALTIDALCLAFAYGGFLALFGSLGGHFALDKLSATVCVFTFAFVYIQYFGLFTVFGGSTPGMMVSGIQVASFTGDSPTPRQYLLRAAGYLLSAGTCFLGFLWVLWDEDGLTWHDRLSDTYLARIEPIGEEETPSYPATAR
jgi:uncharacterized RDD family membrane protein YckC